MNSGPSVTKAPENAGADAEAVILRELYHILADPSFVRSPTLSKLLVYLAIETLNGNGDKLKSYTIAVDCLGKDPDFDAQTDSYPRVQMMRLRKLLDAFYAKNTPLEGLCLYMVPGSYRIRMESPENAYPEFYRHSLAPPSDKIAGHSESGFSEAAPPIEPTGPPDKRAKPVRAIATALSIALMALALAFSTPHFLHGVFVQKVKASAPDAITGRAPVMVIDAVPSAGNETAKGMADEIFATLIDGIGRSWVIRVRLAEGSDEEKSPNAARYRLESRLGRAVDDNRRLYLRLIDTRSSDLLWSTTISLDQKAPIAEKLGPAIARLTGPFGIVATREIEQATPRASGDYLCLLRYMQLLKTRNGSARPALEKCLGKPFDNRRLDAVRLALRSFLIIESSTSGNWQAQLAKANSLVAQSLEADPKEAYAHFAAARLRYVSGDCTTGNIHARLAYDANPYAPILLSVLGNFAAECGLTEADAMLDRAFAFRIPGESYAKLSLVLAGIRSDDWQRLIALSSDSGTGASFNPLYHHLCEALIAAALDRPQLAREHWRRLNRAVGGRMRPADGILAQLIFSKQLRSRIIGYLGEKGVISDASRPM